MAQITGGIPRQKRRNGRATGRRTASSLLVRFSMVYVLAALGVIAALQCMEGQLTRTVWRAYAATFGISTRIPTSTEPRIDLYGNEITNAVGDYRVDRRGNLYERHAPDTAILKIGPSRT